MIYDQERFILFMNSLIHNFSPSEHIHKITIEKYSKRILLWKKLIRQGKSALKNRKFSILSIQKKDIYI